MRNWNSSQASVITKALSRFEPTYEELKLFFKIANRTYTTRFEPTYEELKHDDRIDDEEDEREFWAYLWGIETSPY